MKLEEEIEKLCGARVVKETEKSVEEEKDKDSDRSDSSSKSDYNLSEKFIKEKSKIFGASNSNAKLNDWHRAVNEAAYSLVKDNNELMYDRASLKVQAEAEARKTYVFKKSSGSRSKFEETKPKRARLTQEEKKEKISDLSKEIESIEAHTRVKQQLIKRASDIKDYKQCDNLHTEIRRLINEKNTLQEQMKMLLKKESRSTKYFHTQMSSSSSEETGSSKIKDIRSFLKVKSTSPCVSEVSEITSSDSEVTILDERQSYVPTESKEISGEKKSVEAISAKFLNVPAKTSLSVKENETKIRERSAAVHSMEMEAYATNEMETEDLTAEKSNLSDLNGGAASNQLIQKTDTDSESVNESNDSGNFLAETSLETNTSRGDKSPREMTV